jgi:hypothetical protein
MDDDFDIPSNTKELDDALHKIHSKFIKPEKDMSKAIKESLKKVMCVHKKLSWFPCDLLSFRYCIMLCDH